MRTLYENLVNFKLDFLSEISTNKYPNVIKIVHKKLVTMKMSEMVKILDNFLFNFYSFLSLFYDS